MCDVALPSHHADVLHREQGAGCGLVSQALHNFSHPGDAIPFSALKCFLELFIRYIGILTAVFIPAPTAAPDLVVPASILRGSPLGESALHIGFTALFAEDSAVQLMGKSSNIRANSGVTGRHMGLVFLLTFVWATQV